jgi:hypothetical protein
LTPTQAWKALGIDPTSDKRAIKRAYAGKLKAIDPDKDPKAFLTLRDALQAATWDAVYVDDDGYETWGEDSEQAVPLDVEPDTVDGHPYNIEPISDAELEHDDEPFDDIEPQDWHEDVDPDYDANAPRNRLSTILWGDDDIIPLEQELRTLTNGLIDGLEEETIDVAGETENWLGWIVSATMRRSDCMIPILVNRLGWKAKASGINAPYYMDDIIARYRDLVRLTALRKSGHQDHAVYMRLCQPTEGELSRATSAIHGGKVRAFVASIRAHHPTIEWDFNPDTMAAWEPHLQALTAKEANTGEKSSWGSWRLGFFALLFLAQLLRACPDSSDTPSTAPLPPATQLGTYSSGGATSESDAADPTKNEIDVACRKDSVTQSVDCTPAAIAPPALPPPPSPSK